MCRTGKYDISTCGGSKPIQEETHRETRIPVTRTKTEKRRAMVAKAAILFLQLCERMAYYSILANLVLFGTSQLGFSSKEATNVALIYTGICYTTPVLGGVLSDIMRQRYLTIVLSTCILVVGLLCLLIVSSDYVEQVRLALFYVGLALFSVGDGVFRSTISPFGADQVVAGGRPAVSSFINWLYWSVALGSGLAFTVMAYIQQNISFTWGFLIPLAALVLSLLVFAACRKCYIVVGLSQVHTERSGSAMFFSVLNQGLCKCGENSTPTPTPTPTPGGASRSTVLDRARQSHGGDFDDLEVDGVLSVITTLPIFLLTLMFWNAYVQMQTSLFLQAERMDATVDSIQIPVAVLATFTNLACLLFIPLLNNVIVPCVKKIGVILTPLRKIGLGQLVACAAMVVAGVTELYRKQILNSPGGSHIQTLAEENFTASDLHVLVQTPQFVLIGVGEVFIGTSMMEMAYTQAPFALQGLLTGFAYLGGWGAFLALAIFELTELATEDDPWWGEEINDVKMENLLFLLAGLLLMNFLVFCLVANRYKFKDLTVKDRTGECRGETKMYGHMIAVIDQSVDLNGVT